LPAPFHYRRRPTFTAHLPPPSTTATARAHLTSDHFFYAWCYHPPASHFTPPPSSFLFLAWVPTLAPFTHHRGRATLPEPLRHLCAAEVGYRAGNTAASLRLPAPAPLPGSLLPTLAAIHTRGRFARHTTCYAPGGRRRTALWDSTRCAALRLPAAAATHR